MVIPASASMSLLFYTDPLSLEEPGSNFPYPIDQTILSRFAKPSSAWIDSSSRLFIGVLFSNYWQGYVFTSICDSVHRGDCGTPRADIPPADIPLGRNPHQTHPPRQTSPLAATPTPGRHLPGRHPPGRTLQRTVCILLECILFCGILGWISGVTIRLPNNIGFSGGSRFVGIQ